MKKYIIVISLTFITTLLYSQNITTAAAFFSEVSKKYSNIIDYTVDIEISNDNSTQKGNAIFKRPDFLRIDFSYPQEQAIVFTGSTLFIYLPQYRTILKQDIEKSSTEGASLATPKGLSLMKRAYTIQYETSAQPVPIDESSNESVIVLIMNRKSASETFRRLKVMVSPKSKLIRRIEAIPISGEKITFNLYNYRLNTGVSTKNFVFDGPPTAKVLNDFLFIE